MVRVAAYDDGLFTPMEKMNALSETEFSILGHPLFPNYNVRIKKSTFCYETVKAYTGYIDIEARHIFFYFFESRNDPDTDDIFFWTTGGAKFNSIHLTGPCRISDENGTSFHPESWNTNANIFFVDGPIGVGFSYADYGETVDTTEEAAKDIAAFIFVLFEHFTKFKGRSFHMAGESYGGRYAPVFAAEVYDQNTKLAAAGNGMTDFYHQMSSSFNMMCTTASVLPTLDIASCVQLKQMIPRCEKRLKEACVDIFDAMDCAEVANFCETHMWGPFWQTGLNPYDMSKPCDADGLKDNLCYPMTAHIRAHLDRPGVRNALGVDPAVAANFSSCEPTINSAFRAQLDRGVRVLIYVGTYDWTCNWVGNERWTLALEWSGQAEFATQPLHPWAVGGDFSKGRAGLARSAKRLMFATIDGAGHLVPYDKPREALDIVQWWLSGEGF
ncbi:serine carboxypeptidase [Mycena rosella]|uniref:Carboxypeptidase n=1 Tax=Mycena rosella TaxID=1033263 RepID=A0AAD7CM23_MYCRO|nr:serine carboxypeptidase [Mycena rosella]